MKLHWTPTLLALSLAAITGESAAQSLETEQTLRNEVLSAESPEAAADAFQKYFRHLGASGLREHVNDRDTAIALHAAWEVLKKPVKRPQTDPYDGMKTITEQLRSEFIYDRESLMKFRAVLATRTKVDLPEWWSAHLIDIDLIPGEFHSCGGEFTFTLDKFRASKAGPLVPKMAELEQDGEVIRYIADDYTIEFPITTFDKTLHDGFAGVLGPTHSVVAKFNPYGGFKAKIAGFLANGGRPVWTREVWGTNRLLIAGSGMHRIELTAKDGVVHIFGAESHGVYLEAFDVLTGKCRYRFCTSYWGAFSERWKNW